MRQLLLAIVLASVAAYAIADLPAGSNTSPASMAASAPASVPASRPASMPYSRPTSMPDVLVGALDPYDQAQQRTRFLAAAGVDSELDAEEAAADAKRADGFMRRFDYWDRMKAFDTSANGKLSWTEVEAYRDDLRKKLLADFDVTGDGKLIGSERLAANRAIAAGWPSGAMATSRPSWQQLRDMSPEERRAAFEQMRASAQAAMLERYDLDGDGQLSAEERAQMRRDMRQRDPMAQLFEGIRVAQFDEDADGKLDDREQAAAKDFEKRLQQIGETWRVRMMDADGDGEVSQEETRQFQQGMMAVGLQLMGKIQKAADLDGDGQVSAEERQVLGERMRDGAAKYMETLLAKYDTSGTGRLTEEDREALLHGINENFEQRVAKFAGDGGKVTPDVTAKVIVDFVRDLGVDLDSEEVKADGASGQQD
jgi:Ca2+-binding EF-hand superfamily protein